MLPSRHTASERAIEPKSMNALDIALVVLLAVPTVIGLWKGLVNLAVAFLGLWASVTSASLLHARLAPALQGLGLGAALAEVVAYAAVFVATLLVAGVVGWFVTRSLKSLDLNWVNRFGGALAGLACGALLAGALSAGLSAVAPESQLLQGSVLGPPLAAATAQVLRVPGEGAEEPAEEAGTPDVVAEPGPASTD